MRWPKGPLLPIFVGIALVATVIAAGAVTRARGGGEVGQFVAAARGVDQTSAPVVPLKRRFTPHLLVVAPSSLSASTVDRVRGGQGVATAEVVDAANALVAGKRVGLLGVDPSTFRAFTPKPSAESGSLWRNVAAGDVVVSFTLGRDGGVRLGSMVAAGGSQSQTSIRVGAYATVGIGPVDAVVSRARARQLRMPVGNALIISASRSGAEGLENLRARLKKDLPDDVKVVTLGPSVTTTTDPRPTWRTPGLSPARGEVMTPQQVRAALRAASTKLGMPYVWGGESDAEGGYDCSGIIQWSFAQAGIRMPRVAADQARTGPRLPYSQARAGDLLIWTHDPTAPDYVSHIAIYLGGGKMLVAPRTGDVVKIADVYFRNFRGAVRVNSQLATRLA